MKTVNWLIVGISAIVSCIFAYKWKRTVKWCAKWKEYVEAYDTLVYEYDKLLTAAEDHIRELEGD